MNLWKARENSPKMFVNNPAAAVRTLRHKIRQILDLQENLGNSSFNI
jgi:hypothetical protein